MERLTEDLGQARQTLSESQAINAEYSADYDQLVEECARLTKQLESGTSAHVSALQKLQESYDSAQQEHEAYILKLRCVCVCTSPL